MSGEVESQSLCEKRVLFIISIAKILSLEHTFDTQLGLKMEITFARKLAEGQNILEISCNVVKTLAIKLNCNCRRKTFKSAITEREKEKNSICIALI